MGLSILGLSRFQFAMTTIYHFFFIPVSIGLALAVAIMETIYAVNKNPLYLKMAKFWGKIFLLSFAVGVVTGIIQEFQFGMNWSNYSRFMGDIFGAPLAIEALLAFFLESTFIGVWMFTWDRFKPGVHALFIWLTWLGSTLSAIWILAANSFMQHPTGFEIDKATGHVRLRSFMDVVANPQLWRAFPHVIFAAVMTGGMIILGMSAFAMLHKRTQQHDGDKAFFTKSIRFGAVVALVGAVFVTYAGDLQTQFIIKDQPMKFAATEAIYEDTKDPAPWAVVSLINENDKTAKSIEIPYMLSLLSYHKASGSVKGMDTVDKELHEQYDAKFGKDMNYYVPVNALFWSFRFMALSAAISGLASILALWFTRKGKGDGTGTLMNYRWLLWIMGACTFVPFIGTTGGWLITELGRYPWIVYGLLTIADGVSPTATVPGLLFTNIVYFLLFLLLGAVMIFYSRRVLYQGPDGEGELPVRQSKAAKAAKAKSTDSAAAGAAASAAIAGKSGAERSVALS
ncbi:MULTISPECIES: cytochrome ubiquinol oxidase subunit I [Bifidobacterium]|uniref:cytochrome ubiquinol oxidase subunit I n=1 Tax=Bifidobacterium TaxID=1678 RepID=UPI001F344434|nr:cytochrome ubiquinol oxidase subunit I [Bifidobacterium tibiigranuli]MCH3973760.1 cytochrome ubiquinol oxidase subunit I [Bifidobacterium tibiigranuli]MCH4189875.1 cytochrome ubiquinol oxidase subunit I [Bifidobacterium tibiigranuli]MCH4204534.1 cytochrome ubiquinol oxidase subunit I [Bifidobacterium tibiigranuli]MCH4275235.1 cytochrome ubiquinol oxidase subunit I [Bifidobacterium tibiigranuli]MCI1791826.1 cytochrome ubiquinol oxidase subunit I [Bifidobacterium tibiigranuli]